ncbi:MAG: SAM-dependent methyltransferase [Alphaproteobacteria bacterium]|nr:SAM-dependent methyltransferase [Alphaproteobacteria bacterium]
MATEADSPLGVLIDRQIAETGPVPLSLYMQLCLTHPAHGYYHRPHPIGRAGDFITAPEVSQIFGEAIGLFVALLSRQLPKGHFDLVELGPGRGTLMVDLLRSLHRAAPDIRAGGPTLVEISETMRSEQARRLADHGPVWLGHIDDLPESGPPLVIIANEFFDALPVRQYQKTETGWHERVVGLSGGQRAWGLNPTPLPESAMPEPLRHAAIDERFETRPAADALMALLAERIAGRGGVLVAIDYGYDRTQSGDTVQAIAGHAYADPLARPGEADLTAHVDFEALAAAAVPLHVHGLMTQASFLGQLGAAERAEALARSNPDLTGTIAADLARLTASDQMGQIFKVLCVSSQGISPYPFDIMSTSGQVAGTGHEGDRALAGSRPGSESARAPDRAGPERGSGDRQ